MEVVETDGVPAELYLPDHRVWATASATLKWLERHQVRRRLRSSDDLDAMGPLQRFNTAANAWAVAMGYPAKYDPERRCFPNKEYIRLVGIPVLPDINERLRGVHVKGDDE